MVAWPAAHQGDHGHLRPCFQAMCLPDLAPSNCEISCVTNCTCTGRAEDALTPSERAGGRGSGKAPSPAQPQPRQSAGPLPVSRETSLCCPEHALFREACHVASDGECWREVRRTPSKMGECPFVPRSPALRLAPAVPGTAPTELACVCPWSREGKNGVGPVLFLRLIQCFCPKTATSRTLWLLCPAAGEGPCQAGSVPGAGFCPLQGEEKSDPDEV